MAAAKQPYKAGPISDTSSLGEVIAYIRREFEEVEKVFIVTLLNPMETLHAAPAKLRDGLTVLADGTDWNPGGGQGVYTYYAGAWHKLG